MPTTTCNNSTDYYYQDRSGHLNLVSYPQGSKTYLFIASQASSSSPISISETVDYPGGTTWRRKGPTSTALPSLATDQLQMLRSNVLQTSFSAAVPLFLGRDLGIGDGAVRGVKQGAQDASEWRGKGGIIAKENTDCAKRPFVKDSSKVNLEIQESPGGGVAQRPIRWAQRPRQGVIMSKRRDNPNSRPRQGVRAGSSLQTSRFKAPKSNDRKSVSGILRGERKKSIGDSRVCQPAAPNLSMKKYYLVSNAYLHPLAVDDRVVEAAQLPSAASTELKPFQPVILHAKLNRQGPVGLSEFSPPEDSTQDTADVLLAVDQWTKIDPRTHATDRKACQSTRLNIVWLFHTRRPEKVGTGGGVTYRVP
ncbi:hypothetical protein BKA66DRAFT_551355 [Pyrenochaeta sp. MPI-SDFR-AT-0127]|nr:hypothetical protein BKA66DRAFT_551355 [Pyrenochaeta sp. MPI-SDFR-AT-0127]